MSSKIARKLFARFFLGIATDQEKNALYNSKDSEDFLKDEWDSFDKKNINKPLFDKKRSFNQISQQINGTYSGNVRWLKFAQKYAAILIVGLLITGGLSYFGIIQPYLQQSTALIEFYNNTNKPQNITLSDGSVIIVNNQSKITYPEKFSKSTRIVKMEGEAFFDIAHDKSKPFIVQTSELNIEVLGTKFNVSAFSSDDFIETTLIEGSVRIERTDSKTKQTQKVVLTPNHKATFSKNDMRIIMDQVDVTPYKSWIDGTLIFDNDKLKDITKKLEIKYNTEIILSDEVKNTHRYTLTIQNESIEEVLTILSKTSPVEFSKADNGYLIYGARNN